MRYRLVGLLLLLTVCGCGPQPEKGVKVKGLLLDDGKPMTVPGMETYAGYIEVALIPVEAGKAENEYTTVEASGNFLFIGQEKGIKPGKYKMAVYKRAEGPESDELQGKFSEENTPIEITVPEDKLDEEHDLGTIELTKYK